MNKRLNKLVDDNLYAAFLGRQGVGKSSLVNALLFKKEILPIDVTETTNVLCKIIHSHGMNPGVTVYFKDGTSKEGPPTRDYLADFVDEQHNPENNKRIQEIILRYPIDYLSEGIAFVDTPGVDSMLSHNMKTTMEFLPQVSCAIFVFSTTPSLMDSEVDFLRATWSYAKNFFFVQNVWGEKEEQISSSHNKNMEHIRKLSVEMGSNPDELKVFPVDIHAALDGARNNDENKVIKSGADKLSEAVRSFLNQGGGKLRLLEGTETVCMYAYRMRQACADRLRSLLNESKEGENSFRERIDKGKDDIRQIEKNWDKAKSKFGSDCRKMESDFDNGLDEQLEEARKELKGLLDEGSIDGERFGKALTQKIQVKARIAQEELNRAFSIIARELVDAFVRGMESASSIGSISDYKSTSIEAEGLYGTAQKIGATFNWAGGAGLMFAVGSAAWAAGAVLVAGEGISAAIAAAGAAFPGIGWAVAGAALVGGWLFKKYSKGRKVQELNTVLYDAIRESRRVIRESIKKTLGDRISEVERQLDEDMTRQLDEKKRMLRKMEQDRSLSQEETERLTKALENHRMMAEKKEKRFAQMKEEVLAL